MKNFMISDKVNFGIKVNDLERDIKVYRTDMYIQKEKYDHEVEYNHFWKTEDGEYYIETGISSNDNVLVFEGLPENSVGFKYNISQNKKWYAYLRKLTPEELRIGKGRYPDKF